MSYKISNSLEAQYGNELGTDLFIDYGKEEVVVIKIRSKIKDEVHFNKIKHALERALKKSLEGMNMNC